MRAFDRNGVDLLVIDSHVLALGDLVPLHLVLGFYDIARLRIEHLAAKPVASGAIQRVEGDACGRFRCGVERNGAGDER